MLSLQLFANGLQFCSQGLELVGEPLKYGPQDMAVGIRKDLLDVNVALSYWIQQFRACSPSIPGVCYNGINMDGLFQRWMSTADCDGGPETSASLDPSSFIHIYLFCWGVAGLVLLKESVQSRFFDRLTTIFRGHGLWECLTMPPFACIDAQGRLDRRRLRAAFKASFFNQEKTANNSQYFESSVLSFFTESAYDKVIRCLRRYIVGHNFLQWQLLCATTQELKKEMVVAYEQMDSMNQTLTAADITNKIRLDRYKLDDKRGRAAAKIALYWQTRMLWRNKSRRRDALLKVQRDMLLRAIIDIQEDIGQAQRDRVYSLIYKKTLDRVNMSGQSQPLPAPVKV